MTDIEACNRKPRGAFIWKWVLTNMVGLPALLGAYRLGFFMMLGIAIMADGGSVGYVPYIFALIILFIGGLLMGGWLGFMQWLVLRNEVLDARKWVVATSLGAAIGSVLSWLIYGLIFVTIVARPDGAYFSFAFEYMAFGLSLGIAIGTSQWVLLRQWVDRAEWWIVTLPLCFTMAMLIANFYLVSGILVRPIHWLTQRLAIFAPDIENMQVLFPFAILSALVGLIGVGLVTGMLLDWLLRFHSKQGQSGKVDNNHVVQSSAFPHP